jgi:hypothetical protein
MPATDGEAVQAPPCFVWRQLYKQQVDLADLLCYEVLLDGTASGR